MYFPSPFDPRLKVARDRRSQHLGALLSNRRGLRGLGDDSSFDWTQSTAAPTVTNSSDIYDAGNAVAPVIVDSSSPGFTINANPVLAFPSAGSSGAPIATNTASIQRAIAAPAPSVPLTISAAGSVLASPAPAPSPVSLTAWLSQSMIGGISNSTLVMLLGGVIVLGSLAGGKKKRR
jgi:hypothetical protein